MLNHFVFNDCNIWQYFFFQKSEQRLSRCIPTCMQNTIRTMGSFFSKMQRTIWIFIKLHSFMNQFIYYSRTFFH
ncbi:hypothetical protein A7P25_00865 [Achromobacter xylosoxidans]|nr:hypothetical protein A7P25_00865 [Achromobacter xylosoxidans]